MRKSALRRHRPGMLRDNCGSVTVVFGVASLVLMAMIGLAVDVARYYNIASKMQDSIDAAALAGAKLLSDEHRSDAQIARIVRRNYNTSMKRAGVKTVQVSPLKVQIDRKSSTVAAVSRVKVRSFFGPIINQPRLASIERDTKVVYDMNQIELAMVLDITGSMNANNKLADLKIAATDIIDELLNSAISETSIRIAIAPYSASVNAGALADIVASTPPAQPCTGRRGRGCQSSAGADIDTCVIERAGANAATDAAPNGVDRLPTMSVPPAGNYACPDATVVPLLGKSHISELKGIVDGYAARGATAGHIGTAWGWYLLSPEWANILPSESKPEDYGKEGVNKSMIVMTDGLFNTSFSKGKSSPSPEQVEDSYLQFQALCQGAKSKGITIYTVGFDLADPRAQSELEACASEPTNFFDAKTGAQLKAAFKAIADRLNQLRVAS